MVKQTRGVRVSNYSADIHFIPTPNLLPFYGVQSPREVNVTVLHYQLHKLRLLILHSYLLVLHYFFLDQIHPAVPALANPDAQEIVESKELQVLEQLQHINEHEYFLVNVVRYR